MLGRTANGSGLPDGLLKATWAAGKFRFTIFLPAAITDRFPIGNRSKTTRGGPGRMLKAVMLLMILITLMLLADIDKKK